MRLQPPILATCLVAACSLLPCGLPSLAAQELPADQLPPDDWRMPFRNPIEDLPPDERVFRELTIMFARAQKDDVRKTFNEAGIEVCDDKAWQAAHSRLIGEPVDAGYLSQVIRLSRNATNRRLALYGMFYQRDPNVVMQFINHIPGEPLLKLRQESYPRAMEYLKAHFKRVNPGDLQEWEDLKVGPAAKKPPKPGEFTHVLDIAPYLALLTIDSPIDQMQALWFISGVVKLRPSLTTTYFYLTGPGLYELLEGNDPAVREAACKFIEDLDSKHREAPKSYNDSAKLRAHLDTVFYDLFPPIRDVGPSQVALYDSDDLSNIIETGYKILLDGSAGDATNGKLKNGGYYRGLEITSLPAPIDKLGLKVGWIITSINGVPVASCDDIAKLLVKSKNSRSFLVEYVADGKSQVREFRREG